MSHLEKAPEEPELCEIVESVVTFKKKAPYLGEPALAFDLTELVIRSQLSWYLKSELRFQDNPRTLMREDVFFAVFLGVIDCFGTPHSFPS